MSDTCWLNMTFRKEDLPKFKTVLQHRMYDGKFWDEEDADEDEIEATVYEANYGWYDEIESLAKEGLTFTVSHGNGGTYGPCNYACYEGDLVECNANLEENPVVLVTKGGVNQADLANCMKYYEILDKIEVNKKIRKNK